MRDQRGVLTAIRGPGGRLPRERAHCLRDEARRNAMSDNAYRLAGKIGVEHGGLYIARLKWLDLARQDWVRRPGSRLRREVRHAAA